MSNKPRSQSIALMQARVLAQLDTVWELVHHAEDVLRLLESRWGKLDEPEPEAEPDCTPAELQWFASQTEEN